MIQTSAQVKANEFSYSRMLMVYCRALRTAVADEGTCVVFSVRHLLI